MKETVTVVELEHYQSNIILRALSDLKDSVRDDEDTTDISEIILKIIDAPEKKMSLIRRKEYDER